MTLNIFAIFMMMLKLRHMPSKIRPEYIWGGFFSYIYIFRTSLVYNGAKKILAGDRFAMVTIFSKGDSSFTITEPGIKM